MLDLPWGASKPWTLVDLWEDFDEELLQRFYTELMIPNFPLRDELEPIENFVDGLSESRRTVYVLILDSFDMSKEIDYCADTHNNQSCISY